MLRSVERGISAAGVERFAICIVADTGAAPGPGRPGRGFRIVEELIRDPGGRNRAKDRAKGVAVDADFPICSREQWRAADGLASPGTGLIGQ